MEVTKEGRKSIPKRVDEQIITVGHGSLVALGTQRRCWEHEYRVFPPRAPSILIHQWLRAAFRSISSSALFSLLHANQASSWPNLRQANPREIPPGRKKGVTDTCLGSYQCALEMVPDKMRLAPIDSATLNKYQSCPGISFSSKHYCLRG